MSDYVPLALLGVLREFEEPQPEVAVAEVDLRKERPDV